MTLGAWAAMISQLLLIKDAPEDDDYDDQYYYKCKILYEIEKWLCLVEFGRDHRLWGTNDFLPLASTFHP